jgi:hypothetical protein
VHARLEAAGLHAEFDVAIEALADMPDSAQARTDYGRRRDTLQNWVIGPGQWSQANSGTASTATPARSRRTLTVNPPDLCNHARLNSHITKEKLRNWRP